MPSLNMPHRKLSDAADRSTQKHPGNSVGKLKLILLCFMTAVVICLTSFPSVRDYYF